MKMKYDRVMVRFVADSIVRHVEKGGWLGASWPSYVLGANILNTTELDAAFQFAEVFYWEQTGETLYSAVRRNFEREYDPTDE